MGKKKKTLKKQKNSENPLGVMVMIVVKRHKFKSWSRLFAFHIALILLEKGMNPTFLPLAMDKQ